MEQSADGPGKEPESLARAFVTALDEGRWSDAADLVDTQTRKAFQAWCVEQIGIAAQGLGPESPSDTRFVAAGALMGVSTKAEAARLTSNEFVARFAEAVSPRNLDPQAGAQDASGPSRITRQVMDTAHRSGNRATVRYRTEWWNGEVRNVSMSGIHTLHLRLTKEGWRVRDADLGGWGEGHILPPSGSRC